MTSATYSALSAQLMIGFVTLVLISTNLFSSSQNNTHQHRRLNEERVDDVMDNSTYEQPDSDFRGTTSFVMNKTIYGAIIISDYGETPHVKRHEISVTDHSLAERKRGYLREIAANRSMNARKMISNLPFPVIHWPPVFGKACPYSKSQHKSERGLTYAHYRIWLDFVYFDNELLGKLERKEIKGVQGIDNLAYLEDTFAAAENGTLYKHGSIYRDENIIIIFEDDADIAVVNIREALLEELSNMTTDLLFLGWCKGRFAKPVPLCAHAYAMTLAGARKAIKYIEPCGLALDEQFVIMGKNHWLTFRTAHSYNYENKFNSDYPKHPDNTHGIFHQKNMGSFNGH